MGVASGWHGGGIGWLGGDLGAAWGWLRGDIGVAHGWHLSTAPYEQTVVRPGLHGSVPSVGGDE